MIEMTPAQVLDIPMGKNDSGAETIRSYLVALLAELWREGEGFSGKRPFGNSDWEMDLHLALVRAGAIEGSLDEDGYLDNCDELNGDLAIAAAIRALRGGVEVSGVFYLAVDCDNCDEEVFYGPCGTTLEHESLPVIPYDLAAQTLFRCECCGAENYTGDFEVFSEGGREPAELDADDAAAVAT